MLNAFGEGYLSLLKRFLFLRICRLHFIYVLREIYMEKVLQEPFWLHFFGHPYRSNGTKIHLDATLQHIIFKANSWCFSRSIYVYCSERANLERKIYIGWKGVLSSLYFLVFSPKTRKYRPGETSYLVVFHAVLAH